MATKKKLPPRELPKLPPELVDQFVNGPMTVDAVQHLSMAFKKALIKRMLGAGLGLHLRYPPSEHPP
ncbi:hypothetical protein FXN63_23415 [Pigmentiphaga aceris]|uniref:IS256 family transposase n=1 Tax=Pigmentiphaga aceris TaxID=1940612 RepID=A0A5C0B2E3_9BURK|nr:hypothetical protein FXN63_23415 [Pigmentiphaga aceris]